MISKKVLYLALICFVVTTALFAAGVQEEADGKPTIAMIPMVMVGDPFQVTMAEEAKRGRIRI